MTDGPDRTPAGAILSGVDALVRLLALREELDQRDGLRTATMVSGYPGSPLAGFDRSLARAGDQLAGERIRHQPGLNEELALATVWGSQMGAVVDYQEVDGVAGAWYGKTPGLDRAGDALKHANAMGAGPNGGVVMFCGDDPTAKSSTLTCDSQHTFEDACVPVFYPGSQQEVVDLGVHAFRLSRYAGCWAGMKIVTAVADGIGTVDLDLGRHAPEDPAGLVVDGRPWRHAPLARVGPHTVPDQEALVVDHRLRAARAYVRHNGLDRVVGAAPGARLGIVCAGKTYFDLLQALTDLGVPADGLSDLGVRVLKPAMTWPLVAETVVEFASTVEEIVVIEEKRPFVETQVRSILHEAGSTVPVQAKRDRSGEALVSTVGELDPEAVAAVLTRAIPSLAAPARASAATRLGVLELPPRPPAFCSGCPHNRSTVFPDGALVGGGVGCHGMIYFEARHQGMRALPPTPMGAEGVPWIGLSPFVEDRHLIQDLGDGTLSHSGSLAIRACVDAGVGITFKILYNRAVAMTGGQDVTGLMDVPSMTRALEAEGVARIVVCAEDPKRYGRRARWAGGVEVLDRGRLPEVQEELAQVPGVSVIIYDQRCAAESRRLRRRGLLEDPPRRVVINEAVCEGCGDCSTKSNCLSVLPHETEFGEKRRIDQLSCNKDYTCLEGDCPSFVTLTPKRGRRRRPARPEPGPAARPSRPTGSLPDPVVARVDGQFGVYFTGIGGTGIVTANRIIASAAEAAGMAVGGMDQTGLSQMAGAVVSHLHLATDPRALGSATVGDGGADLYLSGDILQAAGADHLAKVDPGRTVAVVARGVTPTAAMLQSDLAAPAPTDLEAAVAARVGEGRLVVVDAKRIADVVFADHLLANVVLLGAAFQRGGLPFGLAEVDAAMAGGKAAADNRAAFEWGRWAAHDPAAVQSCLDVAEDGEGGRATSINDPSQAAVATAAGLVARRRLPDDLEDLLVRRAAQAVDYQAAAVAERYLDLVERAATVDDAERGWALTRAVAEAWFRLLTYKDEYEVARLHRKADLDRMAHDAGIDGAYSVAYHLHPPVLRRLGMSQKLPSGRPYAVAFRALARMKHWRGTPIDVFGWDRDRRLERAVIEEYEELVNESLGALGYDEQVRRAESALAVKGYGPIKEAAVTAWRAQVAEMRAAAPAGRAG